MARQSQAEEASSVTAYRRLSCRACGCTDLDMVLDLGTQPLANGLRTADQLRDYEIRVPLRLMRCEHCGLAQISHVVDPTILYGPHYPYRSGMSQGWYHHCEELAAEMAFPDCLHLDIGCLDGVLLKSMESRGAVAWGCDPSAPEGMRGVYRELFGAQSRPATEYFDIITAQNVFGHVDDAVGFMQGIAANLAPTGTAVIEAPWVVDLIDKRAWDTIYHEHLSYWGLKSLARCANKAGLSVARVKHFPELHGGTMRYYLGHREAVQTFDSSMCPIWWAEDDLGPEMWVQFANEAHNAIAAWTDYFHKASAKSVMGYGAAAKFSTLLNALPERPPLRAIFDETPSKQGKFSPGWSIPILVPTELALSGADEIVVGASNWKEEIERKVRALGFTGPVKAPW